MPMIVIAGLLSVALLACDRADEESERETEEQSKEGQGADKGEPGFVVEPAVYAGRQPYEWAKGHAPNHVDEFIELLALMADVATHHQGDCEKLVMELETFLEDRDELIQDLAIKIKKKDLMTKLQESAMRSHSERFTKVTENCPEAGFKLLELLKPLMD